MAVVEETGKSWGGGGSSLSQCAKHTQHAKHALARESGGMPPGKFWKYMLWEYIWEHFLAISYPWLLVFNGY